MGERRVTPEVKDRIFRMREAGRSYKAIGKAVGISAQAVSWYCLEACVEPSKPSKATCSWTEVRGPVIVKRGKFVIRRYLPEEDAQLLALEAEGLNYSQIGKRLGRKHNSIKGRLMVLARRDARAEAA
jgi:hypothetical protein